MTQQQPQQRTQKRRLASAHAEREVARLARQALSTANSLQADVDAINQRYDRQRATRRANALSNVIGELQHAREDLMAYSELPGVSGENVASSRRLVGVIEATIEEMDAEWQAEMGQSDAATGANIRRSSAT